jgi:hypothetical protein
VPQGARLSTFVPFRCPAAPEEVKASVVAVAGKLRFVPEELGCRAISTLSARCCAPSPPARSRPRSCAISCSSTSALCPVCQEEFAAWQAEEREKPPRDAYDAAFRRLRATLPELEAKKPPDAEDAALRRAEREFAEIRRLLPHLRERVIKRDRLHVPPDSALAPCKTLPRGRIAQGSPGRKTWCRPSSSLASRDSPWRQGTRGSVSWPGGELGPSARALHEA